MNNVNRGSDDIMPEYIAESITVFAQAVWDSEIFKEAELIYPQRGQQLERGDEDILLALLVPLLPNLTNISMPYNVGLQPVLHHVIAVMP